MADTFTPNLRVRLPETGQYANSWGTTLNADALTLLDHGITGRAIIALGALTTYSLAAMIDGAASESRQFCLRFEGAPASAVTVTVPASVTKKFWLIDNACGQDITLKYAATVGVVIGNGRKQVVWADGADTFFVVSNAVDALTLAGVAAINYARRDVANVFASRNSNPFFVLTDGATVTVDCTQRNRFSLLIAGNRTLALNNPVDGQTVELWVTQDATGGRTLAFPANVVFEGGSAPTLTSAGNSRDRFEMTYNLAGDIWIARSGLNTAAGGATINTTAVANEGNLRLFERVGSPSGAVTANFTVQRGVRIFSNIPNTAALDLSGGFVAGSTINIFNLGLIEGDGGDGGNGGAWAQTFGGPDVQYVIEARNGRPGGNAILGPGPGITVNIINVNGRIWGGGGGGGGGGSSGNNVSGSNAVGGGGGGGAGGGRAGHAIALAPEAGITLPADPADGSVGLSGVGGAGAAGTVVGSAFAGTGGAGGAFGTAGAAGASPTTGAFDFAGGAGGAAGKAYEFNGGGAPNFINGAGAPNVLGAVS